MAHYDDDDEDEQNYVWNGNARSPADATEVSVRLTGRHFVPEDAIPATADFLRQLHDLPRLTCLTFEGAPFTPEIVAAVAALPLLEVLEIRDGGTTEGALLSCATPFRVRVLNLAELGLDAENLAALFTKCPKLEELYLGDMAAGAALRWAATAPTMRTLSASSCSLADVGLAEQPLTNTTLTVLQMDRCRISERDTIAVLHTFRALRVLLLCHTVCALPVWQAVATCSTLEVLHAAGGAIDTPALRAIATLHTLIELNIGNNTVDMDLEGARLVLGLPRLVHLRLGHVDVPIDVFASLLVANTSIEKLRVAFRNFDGWTTRLRLLPLLTSNMTLETLRNEDGYTVHIPYSGRVRVLLSLRTLTRTGRASAAPSLRSPMCTWLVSVAPLRCLQRVAPLLMRRPKSEEEDLIPAGLG